MTNEYVRGLRERPNLKHNNKKFSLKVGDVVIIRADERNRSKWKLGIVEDLIAARDGVVRVAKLRASKTSESSRTLVRYNQTSREARATCGSSFESICWTIQTDARRDDSCNDPNAR